MNFRHTLGQAGETAAARFLERLGMRIQERNWRQGSHELDIVAMDRDELVFVEVRTRTGGGMVSPAESLSPAKCSHFFEASRQYLAVHALWNIPCRFDIVCVLHTDGNLEVEHYRNVDFSRFMGRGNTAWQPW